MKPIVATALDISGLEQAASARGLRLVPLAGHDLASSGAQAALLDGRHAGTTRFGWSGVLVLAMPQGSSLAEALDAGADDAVCISASPAEIAARLAARLRQRAPSLVLGPLAIDPLARIATRNGCPLALLPREYALLLYLLEAQGRCVPRAELLSAVWGLRFDPGTNVVEVHASRLRAKLDRGQPVAMLRTQKGQGYRLTAEP